VAAQTLGLGAFDSTNSAQIIEPSPGICAVMGGAGVTDILLLPPHPPTALPGQCNEHTLVYKKSH